MLAWVGLGLLLASCGTGHPAGSSLRSQMPSTGPANRAYPPLPVSRQASATLPSAPGPAGSGPAPDQQDLTFSASGTGFLVTGYLGGGTGRIQRSTDAGATWSTVWQKAGAALDWVGATGSEVLAAGTYAPPGSDPNRAVPVLLESGDNGASWTSITPSIPSAAQSGAAGATYPAGDWAGLRLDFLNQRVALAVTDPENGQAVLDNRMLRSTDGGQHWSAVSLPGGKPSGGLAFVDPLHGFATGTVTTPAPANGASPCMSQIWKTSDAGATWVVVSGTCVSYLLDAMSFPSASAGFAGGGNFSKYGNFPQRAVLASTDGGAQWSQIYAAGGSASGGGPGNDGPFAVMDFVNASLGYGLVGGCTMGANGPCGGSLWATSDGGHAWTRSSASGLRLALDAPRDLWLAGGGPGGGDVMWHSTDGARSWTPVAAASTLNISGLVASGGTLWLDTDAGQFLSNNDGRSWSALPAAALAIESSLGATVAAVGPSGLVVVGALGTDEVWVSHDGGQSGSTVTVPGLGRGGGASVAFAGPRHGLVLGQGATCAKAGGPPGQAVPAFTASPAPVVATTDGGASWHSLSRLDLAPGSIALGNSMAVVAGTGPGPTPPCPPEVATSTDGGTHWKTWSMPAGYRCGSPSAAGNTAVLVCPDFTSSPLETTILVSRDAGHSWTAERLNGSQQLDTVMASGSGELWADGPPGVLWHSTDGGAHWSGITPTLPVAS